MRQISLTINGEKTTAEIEPRMSLADFLRENQLLHGTHIGCEHGVCGACTIIVDGAPARSCITYAVACQDAEITTIEGLEDDQLTNDLRQAFHINHGLQCGYCTPAMMISARDIITRLPDADEERVRRELSGNLCRCTGYVGIVASIMQVKQAYKEKAKSTRERLGPLGSHSPADDLEATSRPANRPAQTSSSARPATSESGDLADEDWQAVETQGVELNQSFTVQHDRDAVWAFFDDLDKVARCMPGAKLTSTPKDGKAEGAINVKLGPITSAFSGLVDVKRDDKTYTGRVRGAGRDANSASRARGLITYQVTDTGGTASQIDVSVKFLLAGALAQFSRSGLVKDVANHLTKTFAENLEASLSGKATAAVDDTPLDANALARAAVWNRIASFFRRLLGK